MLASSHQKDFISTKNPLEQRFIDDFLAEKGYSLEDLKTLPEDVSNNLMIEAFAFASEKLLEIQMRVQYLQSLSFEEW
jgi:hypothetical protein